MCWSFNFGFPGNKKRKSSSSSDEKKRRDRPADNALHGEGRPVAAEYSEKCSSKESSRKRRSGDSTPRSPRREREREEHRPRSQHHYEDAHRNRERHRSVPDIELPDTGVFTPQSTLISTTSLLDNDYFSDKPRVAAVIGEPPPPISSA
ncbi:unnamed protein product [Alternaria alternata]